MSSRLILEPIQIGPVTLRNRLAMPPMVRLAPHVSEELLGNDGLVTPAIVEHYAQRARAGTALIIVEAACVDPSGRVWRQGLNAYDDTYSEGLRALATAIRDAGAVPGIQLVHGGPQADPSLCGGKTFGPSEVAPSVGEPEPIELSVPQILDIEQRFIDAAQRVADAGFTFIELHAAHGYLLDSFISPIRNHRTDAFGGTLENRMRPITDILLRLRAVLGEQVALGARISVFNHVADGFGVEELQRMVRILQDAGSDFVDLSCDKIVRTAFGTQQSMGQLAKAATSRPVIVAGGVTTLTDAETILREGHGDVVGVGRAMLNDPLWAERALATAREDG